MRKKIYTALLITLFTLSLASHYLLATTAPKKQPYSTHISQLDTTYKEWLDLVLYIISPTEKEVFSTLTTNHQRDQFITMFWNLRDPSTGTRENEFKEEHLKRFQYASYYFKFGSPLPGWKTDRGRIWIILGPPVSHNEVNNNNGLYPVDIWEYHGSVEKGLPTLFNVVFYKPSGTGDYKLYIPTDNGPASLLRSAIGEIDAHDYRTIYEKIKEFEPNVAEIALSLIPGENLLNYSPSLQAPLLISQIYELPKKHINTTYARNFRDYQGLVETNVITNYINLKSNLHLFYDGILKLNFIHFALLPEKISVDYLPEKDQYYFNFELMVFIKKGEDTIFQYTKNYPFYYSKQDLETKISHGIIITDYFPIIPGDFKIIALLQNSLNKELSYFEKQVKTKLPDDSNTTPLLYGPLMSYQFNQEYLPVYTAFSVMDTNLKIDPQQSFGQHDTIYSFFAVARGNYTKKIEIILDVISLDESHPFKKKMTFTLPTTEPFKTIVQPIKDLKYGNYEITIHLQSETGKILAKQATNFQVSPKTDVPHPPLASKTLKREHAFLFDMMVAQQYLNLNLLAKAEEYFEKALQQNPNFPELIKSYCSLLLKIKKYHRILEIIKNLEKIAPASFDYYAIKGRALYYLNNFEEALQSLRQANDIYDSNIPVLNTLGLTLLRLNNKEEAILALSSSLKINNNQPDIQALLNQLMKR